MHEALWLREVGGDERHGYAQLRNLRCLTWMADGFEIDWVGVGQDPDEKIEHVIWLLVATYAKSAVQSFSALSFDCIVCCPAFCCVCTPAWLAFVVCCCGARLRCFCRTERCSRVVRCWRAACGNYNWESHDGLRDKSADTLSLLVSSLLCRELCSSVCFG